MHQKDSNWSHFNNIFISLTCFIMIKAANYSLFTKSFKWKTSETAGACKSQGNVRNIFLLVKSNSFGFYIYHFSINVSDTETTANREPFTSSTDGQI